MITPDKVRGMGTQKVVELINSMDVRLHHLEREKKSLEIGYNRLKDKYEPEADVEQDENGEPIYPEDSLPAPVEIKYAPESAEEIAALSAVAEKLKFEVNAPKEEIVKQEEF
jgi:hypothetical protein